MNKICICTASTFNLVIYGLNWYMGGWHCFRILNYSFSIFWNFWGQLPVSFTGVLPYFKLMVRLFYCILAYSNYYFLFFCVFVVGGGGNDFQCYCIFCSKEIQIFFPSILPWSLVGRSLLYGGSKGTWHNWENVARSIWTMATSGKLIF